MRTHGTRASAALSVLSLLLTAQIARPQEAAPEECAIRSLKCREKLASLLQARLATTSPDLHVRVFGDVMVVSDLKMFEGKESRTLFLAGIQNSAIEAQLCTLGFKKMKVESSADATLEGAPAEQYDLHCPEAEKPAGAIADLAGGRPAVPQENPANVCAADSDACRSRIASMVQEDFSKAAPKMRTGVLGDVIVFADPKLFEEQESRTSFRGIVQTKGLEAQLCRFGFKKMRLESADAPSETISGDEYDLRCPESEGPTKAKVELPSRAFSSSPAALSSGQQPQAGENRSCDAVSSTKPTLCQVRKKYLNRRVIVTGALFNERSMLEWERAVLDGARFVHASGFANLPAGYKGQTATVVAVQLNQLKVATRVNALGETVDQESTVDPYFDLVVHFDDGAYGMLSTYPTTAEMSVTFAEEEQALSDLIAKNEGSLLGTSLYACGYSRLYEPDSTLEEMTGSAELLKRLYVSKIPLLKPLRIAAVRYIPANDDVVLKLQFPDGQYALSVTYMKIEGKDKTSSPLQRISGSMLTALPSNFSLQETNAVQKGEIFRGMSSAALECALGFPKQENDWGRGGKQLIFTDTLYVYVDEKEKVVDWPNLYK
jgi:hypothetical protein